MRRARERRLLVPAILFSLALHAAFFLIHVPVAQKAPSESIEIVTMDLGAAPVDVPQIGGPPAARQDLPPERAEEPPPLPAPAPPTPPQPQIADLPEVTPTPTAPEPAPVPESTAPESAAAEDPPASAAVTPDIVEIPRAAIASGGVVGGTGLPGGGTSVSGSQSGSSAQVPVSKERRYIPYFNVDRPPQVVTKAALVYPIQARRRNLEGKVVLEADIDETGKVQAVRVVKTAGFGFDEAAVTYIKGSTFTPAYVGQNAVSVVMQFSILFSFSN